MDPKNRQHIVIVGGGFGGISAAKQLKKADVDVTLIDRSNHHLFQLLLYQVATAALSPGDIAAPKLREPYLTYVIIGGGPTGVEMAGAIAEIAKRNMMRDYKNISKNETRIFLVEAGPKILNGYTDELSEKARGMLEDMGVRLITDRTDCPYCKYTEKSTDEMLALIEN